MGAPVLSQDATYDARPRAQRTTSEYLHVSGGAPIARLTMSRCWTPERLVPGGVDGFRERRRSAGLKAAAV